MLRKLLKYDFKAVFKYWWIIALSSFVMSVLTGGCVTVISGERTLPVAVSVLFIVFIVLDVIALSAFAILSVIFVYLRLYKNFFTDEGYLTFTLPVKRTSLLNSKLITAMVTLTVTAVLIIFNIFLTLAIAFKDELFTNEAFESIRFLLSQIQNELGGYLVIFIIEAIVLLILIELISVLFITACITFASIISKKAKVVVAIGIYYVVNGIFSSIFQVFYFIGVDYVITRLPEGNAVGSVAMIGFGVIVLFALISSLLYTLEYWMLDRKLNLA